MIGEPVPHPANVAMVIIKDARAPLPGPAVVDDNEFPPGPLHRGAPDRLDVRGGQITIIRRLPRKWPPAALDRRWRRRWFIALFLFEPRFLHRDVGRK